MASLTTVSWLLAIPTGAMMVGGLLVFFYDLGPKQIAGMQHLASGILLAAVAYELVPTLDGETHGDKGAFIGGFLLGAAVLMFIARYDFKHWRFAQCMKNREQSLVIGEKNHMDEETGQALTAWPNPESPKGTSASPLKGDLGTSSAIQLSASAFSHSNETSKNDLTPGTNVKQDTFFPSHETSKNDLTADDFANLKGIPKGLIFAVILDGSIDGFLIGISYISGGAAGLITSIALALEMTLLGISTITTLRKRSLPSWKIMTAIFTLPLPIIGVGLLGCTVLRGLDGAWLVGISAFGCAALLYLVSEELLIEAHEEEETDYWYVSGLFFVGFLLVGILDEYAPENF